MPFSSTDVAAASGLSVANGVERWVTEAASRLFMVSERDSVGDVIVAAGKAWG
jgi:hypothetical protein